MNELQGQKLPTVFSLLLYLSGFFLFLEWLYPTAVVGETSHFSVFIIYAIFCFLLTIVQTPIVVSVLLKGSGLLYIVHMLFLKETFLSKAWFQTFSADLFYNLQQLFAANWYAFTPPFRTILFLIIIWLMSYLLYYWMVLTQKVMTFSILTIVYIAVIDTFTLYDGKWAIVRTFIIALLILGLTNLIKEVQKETISFSLLKKSYTWLYVLIVIILSLSTLGYITPVYEAQWQDPIALIQGMGKSQGKGGKGLRKVGYGEDDTQLGGPFIQDETPVFRAVADRSHYWRIETKDVYTGKGWVSSDELSYTEQEEGQIDLSIFSDHVSTERRTAYVQYHQQMEARKMVYPYGIDQVHTDESLSLLLSTPTEALQIGRDEQALNTIERITMVYEDPTYDIFMLREIDEADPEDIKQRYTQLPKDLPSRIQELAEEITESDTNRYDQAKSIEQYFGQSGFLYQIEDVPFPGEDEDYVDQFLFDSKVGYCDNYSTSMVVMLRTLGVPARWVKGFTGGEELDLQGEDGKDVYEITNSNAHSWVEVYFPTIGWIPFEPTQGFSNTMAFEDSSIEHEDETEDHQDEEETDDEEEEEDIPLLEDFDDPIQSATNLEDQETNVIKWSVVLSIFIVLLILFLIGYHYRLQLKTVIVSIQLKQKQNEKRFQEAYHHLLKILESRGLPMEKHQTLREYARRIDRRFETKKMSELTAYYEQMLYSHDHKEILQENIYPMWRQLIRHIVR